MSFQIATEGAFLVSIVISKLPKTLLVRAQWLAGYLLLVRPESQHGRRRNPSAAANNLSRPYGDRTVVDAPIGTETCYSCPLQGGYGGTPPPSLLGRFVFVGRTPPPFSLLSHSPKPPFPRLAVWLASRARLPRTPAGRELGSALLPLLAAAWRSGLAFLGKRRRLRSGAGFSDPKSGFLGARAWSGCSRICRCCGVRGGSCGMWPRRSPAGAGSGNYLPVFL